MQKKVIAVELSKDMDNSLMQQARQTVQIANSDRKWSEIIVGVSTEGMTPKFSIKDRSNNAHVR